MYPAAARRPVTPADVAKARSEYTRVTEHYRLAHHLYEAVAARRRPRSLFESSPLVTAGVSLNMAELFELAVYPMLREPLEPTGFTVSSQASDAHALRDGAGERYATVRPDLLVYRDGVPVAVLDAKYKDYWEAAAGRATPVRRVGNDDVYQLFFYASRLQHAHGLAAPPPAVIVSPVPSAAELVGRQAIAGRFRTIVLDAGGVANRLVLELLPLSSAIGEVTSAGAAGRGSPSVDALTAALPFG